MQITVMYLGGSRSQTGTKSETLELAEGTLVSEAIAQITASHPALEPYLGSVRWAVNYEFAPPTTLLNDGDELALIPPVQGGAPNVLVTTDRQGEVKERGI